MENHTKHKRDLEKERIELLKLMEREIPLEVKEAIDIVISAMETPKLPQVTISYKGANDANKR